jgi:hypothetical protein
MDKRNFPMIQHLYIYAPVEVLLSVQLHFGFVQKTIEKIAQ